MFAFTCGQAQTPVASTAVLTGIVSNQATRNSLEGATVRVSALGLKTLTDGTGRYVFTGLPPGTHEVEVSYFGLDSARQSVEVKEGQRTPADFALTAQVYQLEAYKVTGEREGNALAVTAQRNAANVKNVVAMDSFGNLPNMSAGEVAARLPGVASQFDDAGNIAGVYIRGTPPGLNRLSVDGNLISNVGGFGRNFQMHSMTGALFEQLEVIKGQTPDLSADSVGGSINLKKRSPLSIAEKRRVLYNLGLRWAPSFFDHNRMRRDYETFKPIFNVAYTEVFDVFGGRRNLGAALTGFYSENVNSPETLRYNYQNTTASPAYLWDYRTVTNANNRKQMSFDLKAEYRVSDNTKVFISALYNDANEDDNRILSSRAFSNQTIATVDSGGNPTDAGAILPNFTNTFTTVRAVSGSTFELNSTEQSFFNRTRMVHAGAEHKYARWELDYDASYSQTHNNLGSGKGGILVMRVPTVGWTIDTTDPENPRFTQTAGPSIYNIASYNNSIQFSTRNDARDIELANAKLDALYRLPTDFESSLKAGVYFRHHKVAEVNGQRRWNRVGTGLGLPTTTDVTADEDRTGLDLPFADAEAILGQVGDSTRWTEDIYFRESQKYSATRGATEDIGAAYVMGKAKINKLGVLAGVRSERTEVEAWAYVRGVPATAAQIPDPALRAEDDWNHRKTNQGSYTRSFPSIHLSYDVTNDLKLRSSWSTSFGRPAFGQLLPNANISETAQTVTVGNPALGPQYAKNLDFTAEYYFKPSGLISIGYFTKDIADYILTTDVGIVGAGADNGFDGDYAGYRLLSTQNSGTAEIEGWEFDYRQDLTFLPGLLRGLSVAGNYTYLTTFGDYGGTTARSTNEIASFIPRTANASVFYKYRGFNARVLVNYTGRYLDSFSATPGQLLYRAPRTIVNLGLSYQLREELSFFCDVSNVFDEPHRFYRYERSRVESVVRAGTSMTIGVSGRF